MKIGVIAEFNPFHKGHKYLLESIKNKYPNSYLIIALSSDYVQRGEIACMSWEDRALAAKKFGADEVIPLDFYTSTQAAHIFAEGAINTLLKKEIDMLIFGASDGDKPEKYVNAATAIKNNLEIYNKVLKQTLKTGRSFVYSAYESLKQLIGEENIPTDILGLEYAKYIIFNNLSIKIDTIKRTIDHNSEMGMENYAPASVIRKMLANNEDVSQYIPIQIKKDYPKIEDKYLDFQKIVKEKTPQELSEIHLMSEGMENLFKKNIDLPTYEEFVEACTSKRYTHSRIKRVILYTLLQIKKS
ncbi:nucleotidyltransferase [[Mycoplasma] falconis]|uniref:Nucleotidyltransferase n=1 Tax=[Mycoplasma] falconis TaxID=92403 RepID=A0A501XBP0_9BACT|nr:nucleotidyltransferase [[Mycoplasma] falconis]TPE57767.1 nucleotidyltransferase [[Mycoplasma] falconis]